jgi:uncharacterized protein YceH (UPF0502 family)
MSSEPQSSPPVPTASPALSLVERRVLGVMVEKAKTTPDAYPLSINALVTGCNQKSNRDPLMDLTDVEVEDALVSAQQKGLTTKITGGRVVRWRHSLYEAWRVDKVELAVLGELLLRGPQTEGELRSRASRMEPIDDLDALRAVLRPMTERGLVVYLTPEGRRGTVLTHGLYSPEELEALRAKFKHEAVEASAPVAGSPRPAERPQPAADASLTEACAEIAALRGLVSDLQAQVARLMEQVQRLERAADK